MEKTIWKFELGLAITKIEMPERAQVLTAQMQSNQLCLWALVDPDAKKRTRIFGVFETGYSISEDNITYITTFQVSGGALIFHVFELLN